MAESVRMGGVGANAFTFIILFCFYSEISAAECEQTKSGGGWGEETFCLRAVRSRKSKAEGGGGGHFPLLFHK